MMVLTLKSFWRQILLSQIVVATLGMVACDSETTDSSTNSQETPQPSGTATGTGVGTPNVPHQTAVVGPFSNTVACREKEVLKKDPQCRRADEPAVRQANN